MKFDERPKNCSVELFFHPAAEVEHLESVVFYESRQPGLGASYLSGFDEAMKAIIVKDRTCIELKEHQTFGVKT